MSLDKLEKCENCGHKDVLGQFQQGDRAVLTYCYGCKKHGSFAIRRNEVKGFKSYFEDKKQEKLKQYGIQQQRRHQMRLM